MRNRILKSIGSGQNTGEAGEDSEGRTHTSVLGYSVRTCLQDGGQEKHLLPGRAQKLHRALPSCSLTLGAPSSTTNGFVGKEKAGGSQMPLRLLLQLTPRYPLPSLCPPVLAVRRVGGGGRGRQAAHQGRGAAVCAFGRGE